MATKSKKTVKRRYTYRRRRTGVSGLDGVKTKSSRKTDFGKILQDTALILAGVVCGAQVKSFVEKRDTVQGTDLLGFDGETSKFTTPAIVAGLGLLGTFALKNDVVNKISQGLIIAGAAGLVNNLTGKNIVPLGDADLPVMPGIGDANLPALPGIGNDAPIYVDENGNVVNGFGEIVYDPQTGEPLQTVNGDPYGVPGLPSNNDLLANQYLPGQSPIATMQGVSEFDLNGVIADEYFN